MLCFKDNTNNILREHSTNIEQSDEKTQIIKTALKLICNDIALIELDPKLYPTTNDMTDIQSQLSLVPDSLQMFLRPILKTDERVAIWGQNFIKACWPRSGIFPYQIGLSVQLDHRYGSKWMLDKLHRLGYTESYSETQNYKYCFLNERNRFVISDTSKTLDSNLEEADNKIDNDIVIDDALNSLSVLPGAKNEISNKDYVVSREESK